MRSLLRIAVAVALVEGAAGLIVYVALQTEWAVTWPAFALLAGMIGLLATFWLNAALAHEAGRAAAKLGEAKALAAAAAAHAKERETIRVKAEQAKAKALQEAERVRAKAGGGGWSGRMQWGLTMGAGLGLGFALMLTQFVTLGLAFAMGVGGAGAGYVLRMRHESRRARRLEAAERAPLIEAQATPPPSSRPRLRLSFFGGKPGEEPAPPPEEAPVPKPKGRRRRKTDEPPQE